MTIVDDAVVLMTDQKWTSFESHLPLGRTLGRSAQQIGEPKRNRLHRPHLLGAVSLHRRRSGITVRFVFLRSTQVLRTCRRRVTVLAVVERRRRIGRTFLQMKNVLQRAAERVERRADQFVFLAAAAVVRDPTAVGTAPVSMAMPLPVLSPGLHQVRERGVLRRNICIDISSGPRRMRLRSSSVLRSVAIIGSNFAVLNAVVVVTLFLLAVYFQALHYRCRRRMRLLD